MNSRRFIAAPGNSKQGIVLCLGNTLKGGCPLWVRSGHFAAFRALAFDQQRQKPFQCMRDHTAAFRRWWLLPLFVPSYSTQMWGRVGVWLVIIAMVAIWVAAIYVVIWQPVSLFHLLPGR
jgi:hypothetical protein